MKLRDLGERKAVELIQGILSDHSTDLGGMKDDCAVLDLGDYYLLITTDMISKATHIPEKASPWQVGWHVVAVNLSDIAAMGGEPLGMVVALGLPADYEVKFLKEIVKGARSCASKFNIPILGGDTKETDTLTISGCAFGRVAKNDILLRSGAKSKDVLAVTEDLGCAASAYYSLKNKIDEEHAIKDILEINPRIREGLALSKTGTVTSCMDISDGLASSLYQLSKINDVGYQVDFDQIPVSTKAKAISKGLNIPLEDLSLYFGGDYELLFTVDKEGIEVATRALSDIGTELTIIGEVTEDKKNTLIRDGVSTLLENRGYEHFR